MNHRKQIVVAICPIGKSSPLLTVLRDPSVVSHLTSAEGGPSLYIAKGHEYEAELERLYAVRTYDVSEPGLASAHFDRGVAIARSVAKQFTMYDYGDAEILVLFSPSLNMNLEFRAFANALSRQGISFKVVCVPRYEVRVVDDGRTTMSASTYSDKHHSQLLTMMGVTS